MGIIDRVGLYTQLFEHGVVGTIDRRQRVGMIWAHLTRYVMFFAILVSEVYTVVGL